MTFQPVLDAYLDHLDLRAYSPNTIRRLRVVLSGFARFCDPLAADADAVEAWLATRNLAARARYTYIQYLAGFYRFAVRRGHAAADPTAGIDRPRGLGHLLPRPIPTDALAVALAMADVRMRLWLCLAAYGGLRCQEIAGLCAEHVMAGDPPMLLVAAGKGGRQRTVPLNETTESALAAYRDTYRCEQMGPLFRRSRGCGCALCPQTVSIYIGRYLGGLGIPQRAHTLRHWFGTQVYRQSGGDIRLTQELLGHASIATTQIYTQVAPLAGVPVVRALDVRLVSA